MDPKDGTAGSAVSPAEPEVAEEADVADPGEMAEIKREQVEKQEGKYGTQEAKPFKPPSEEEQEEEPLSWIEIELVGEDDAPIPGAKYRITFSDDTEAKGTLDDKGLARIDGVPEGDCRICFPDLDASAWEPA